MTLRPMDFRGPIETTVTNQFVEDQRPFFWRSHQNSEKTVPFCLEDLFFRDHIKMRRKLWHFSLLFWTTQNQRCVIFELTPGPRLALGAPAHNYCYTVDDRSQELSWHMSYIEEKFERKQLPLFN